MARTRVLSQSQATCVHTGTQAAPSGQLALNTEREKGALNKQPKAEQAKGACVSSQEEDMLPQRWLGKEPQISASSLCYCYTRLEHKMQNDVEG